MPSLRSASLVSIACAAVLAACGDEDGGASSGTVVRGAHTDAGDARAADGGATSEGGDAGADAGAEETGEATWYDADGTGACGLPTSNADDVAAINDEQYSKEVCGKCAAVTGPNGTVVVKILDRCPGCDRGDIDLSQTAFAKIAKLSDGRVKISWRFVPCP